MTMRLAYYHLMATTILTLMIGCAGIEHREVTYKVEGKEYKGLIAYDKGHSGPRPGILIVHEWWGHTNYVRQRADMLAKKGYVAFALDMYGDGKTAEHPKDAKKFSSQVFQKLPLAERNVQKAMEVLKKHPSVNPNKVAAIGYCFGGGIVLEMAKRGLDFDGVVSFHGMLNTPTKPEGGDVKAEVLVFHGGKDPMVSAKDLLTFKGQMRNANADFEVIEYPDATHAFTNPDATQMGKKFDLPIAYNQKADKDSWQKMLSFLRKIFSK